jgi:hypothetical protein
VCERDTETVETQLENFKITLRMLKEKARKHVASEPANRARVIGVDHFCCDVARRLGETITSRSHGLCDRNHLGWIFGQYRGTPISGRRRLQDYYLHKKLKPNAEATLSWEEYLLRVYWTVHGIGLSVGEIFDTQVQENLQQQLVWPCWHALKVTLHDDEQLRFTGEWNQRTQNDVAYYELKVPKAWCTELLGSAWEQICETYYVAAEHECFKTGVARRDEGQANAYIASLLEERAIFDVLERCSNKVYSNLLAAGCRSHETQTVKNTVMFLRDTPSSNVHEILDRVLRAIQLLCMYWKRSQEVFGECVGDLLVLSPTPPRQKPSGQENETNIAYRHAPRVGFALLFVHDGDECASEDSAKVLAEFLTKALWKEHHLLTFGEFGASDSDSLGKPMLSDFQAVLGQMTINTLKDSVIRFVDHEHYAEAMLCSALHLATDLASLTPTFVHEGHRYGVNFLLGSSYHCQVVGKETGLLSEYLMQTIPSKDRGKFHRIFDNKDARKMQRSLLRNLVHDSFSFLDSPNVAVLTHYLPGNPRMVDLHSVVELASADQTLSTVQKFEAITERYKHLFAICVGRNGKVWFMFGGRTLLEFTGVQWVSASAEGGIVDELSKAMRRTSPLKFEVWRDRKAMEGFAKLLQRIAEAGVGGTFVIRECTQNGQAEAESLQSELGYVSEPPPFFWRKSLAKSLQEEPPTLLQLARMDGAVLIEVSGGDGSFTDRWQNAQVWPRRVLAEKCDLRQYEEKWNKRHNTWIGTTWHEYRSWGIRRASALAYAMARKGSELVIAISADGPIYFLSGASPYVVKYPSSETG